MKMVLNFILFICVCVATFFLCAMDGCETNDTVLEDPAGFQEAIPPRGSEIDPNATILVSFDAPPTDVSVSGGTFSVSGTKVTINGPFPPGPLNLNVAWRDGTISLSYTVNLPAPGEAITSGDGRTMVLIPAGEFTMGTNTADLENWLNEGPAHTVHVDAFYMDRHEVTNANFKIFILAQPEWAKENIPDALHHGFYLAHWQENNQPPLWKAEHPVTRVTWHAAMAYAQWAGKRLPTEAEWEYAARGGLVGKAYPWGDTISPADANYNFSIGDTREVGKYRPNDYGLYDMAGNVWEWCLDEAADPNFYARSPLRNPLAGVTGNTLANLHELISNFMDIKTDRVFRGGSHYSSPETVRVTTRGGNSPRHALGSVGFRCVKDFSP